MRRPFAPSAPHASLRALLLASALAWPALAFADPPPADVKTTDATTAAAKSTSASTTGSSAQDDEDKMPPPGYLPGHRERDGLGLSPHAPGMPSILPGGITPAFGAPLMPNEGAKFDFHGYLQAGGRVSLGTRKDPTSEQSGTTWHGDPLVPRGNVFEQTNTVPFTWAELRFSYSLPQVTANVSLGAWSLSESQQAAGSFMPNAQLWIRDAFLTYVPKGLGPIKLTWNVGVYEERYGAMAEYSNGAYGTPIVASIPGVGETLSVGIPLATGVELDLEHGLKTGMGRPPVDIQTGPTNNWQKPWEGQTIVNHAHVGLNYKDMIRPTFHIVTAMARDDQVDGVALGSFRAGYQSYVDTNGQPGVVQTYPALDHADGSLNIVAADIRLKMQRFGYFYGGVSRASVDHARTLSGVVQILYAGGGRDLMDRYFGRNNDQGRGSLLLAAGQYDVSLGELLRYPGEFWGEGPDLKLSVFGMYGHITSDDPSRDGEDKYKFGAEGTYSALSWLAGALRLDRSVPYAHIPKVPLYPRQNDNSFSVVTLKAIFRSDWLAREALTLQYSRYIYRSNFHLVGLNSGGQISTQSDSPDQNVFALFGTLWW